MAYTVKGVVGTRLWGDGPGAVRKDTISNIQHERVPKHEPGTTTFSALSETMAPSLGDFPNETIRITHTRLRAAELATLLDSCAPPGLKSFTYEATYPSASSFGIRKSNQEQGSASSTIRLYCIS